MSGPGMKRGWEEADGFSQNEAPNHRFHEVKTNMQPSSPAAHIILLQRTSKETRGEH